MKKIRLIILVTSLIVLPINIYSQDQQDIIDARYQFLTDLCSGLSKENMSVYGIDELKYYLSLTEELMGINKTYGYAVDINLLNELRNKINSRINHYLQAEKQKKETVDMKNAYENSVVRFIFTNSNEYTYRTNYKIKPDAMAPDANLFNDKFALDVKFTFNEFYKLGLSLSDRFNVDATRYYSPDSGNIPDENIYKNIFYDGINTYITNKISPGFSEFAFLDIYTNFDFGIENIASDSLSIRINPLILRFKDADYPVAVLWEYDISFPIEINLNMKNTNVFTVSNYFKFGFDPGIIGAPLNGSLQFFADDKLDYDCRFSGTSETGSNILSIFRAGYYYSLYFFSTWLFYRLESGYDFNKLFNAFNSSGIEVGVNFYLEYFTLGFNYIGKSYDDGWNSFFNVFLSFKYPVYHNENFIFPAFSPAVLRTTKFWE
jgi:hypothetical protein